MKEEDKGRSAASGQRSPAQETNTMTRREWLQRVSSAALVAGWPIFLGQGRGACRSRSGPYPSAGSLYPIPRTPGPRLGKRWPIS